MRTCFLILVAGLVLGGCRAGYEDATNNGTVPDATADSGADGTSGPDAASDTDGGAPDGGPACGDGHVEPGEGCDDANEDATDGCDSCVVTKGWTCSGAPSVCRIACGDAVVLAPEACDDGGTVGGDGCSAQCKVEEGWDCGKAEPSQCSTICGDGKTAGDESCDDGQLTPVPGDGCSEFCVLEPGWACTGTPSVCEQSCGDGVVDMLFGEDCDDSGTLPGDGCSPSCKVEPGWFCDDNGCSTSCGDGAWAPGIEECDGGPGGSPGCVECVVTDGYECNGAPGDVSDCDPICGDGKILEGEKCDDDNNDAGDGCSPTCKVEGGYSCKEGGQGWSVCSKCGDGVVGGEEDCDDQNLQGGDGCDAACGEEFGYKCSHVTGSPSDCYEDCGDGFTVGTESCDGGNTDTVDGCTACVVDGGWECTVDAVSFISECSPKCGDGKLVGSELEFPNCDDGNDIGGDGCTECTIDEEWNCMHVAQGANEKKSECCFDPDDDGYGNVGTCPLGPDCEPYNDDVHPGVIEECDGVDNDCDGVTDGMSTACYEDSDGNDLTVPAFGVCTSGSKQCVASVWSSCIGQVLPSIEVCNGLDDDCDGTPDEDLGTVLCGPDHCSTAIPACGGDALQCGIATIPFDVCGNGMDDDCNGIVDDLCECVWVEGDGLTNLGPPGTLLNPYGTIQGAIDHVAASMLEGEDAKTVCVLGNALCQGAQVYEESITMSNGVSVQGGYSPITHEPGKCDTVVRGSGAQTVLFPDAVSDPTTLSDMIVEHVGSDGVAIVRTVLVAGASGAIIQDAAIRGNTGEGHNTVYGIEVRGTNSPGTFLQVRDTQVNGSSAALDTSIGVYVKDAKLHLQVCSNVNGFGRCVGGSEAQLHVTNVSHDDDGGPMPLHGRAIVLDNAVGSVVSKTAARAVGGTDAFGIEVLGNATDVTLSKSAVDGMSGGGFAYGIYAHDCASGGPAVIGNHRLAGGGAATTSAGVVIGTGCGSNIEGNQLIGGGAELPQNGSSNTYGVWCKSGASCSVSDNGNIAGVLSGSGVPSLSVGVFCGNEACHIVRTNKMRGARGDTIHGLWVQGGGTPLVERNEIKGGCAIGANQFVVGILLDDSDARVENNFVLAGNCAGSPSLATFIGMEVRHTLVQRDADVHSNTFRGDGNEDDCISVGVMLDASALGIASEHERGLYRNNLIVSGSCETSVPMAEAAGSTPGLLVNNHFVQLKGDGALYWDEAFFGAQVGGYDLFSGPEIDLNNNGSGSQSGDPGLGSGYPYTLEVGSPLKDEGALQGAPSVDFHGFARADDKPDIGCVEGP